MKKITLRKTKRFLAGHQWVFSNELAESPKGFAPGALVEIYGLKEEFLGIGYVNPQSLIAVRVLSRVREEIGEEFFKDRIFKARGLREDTLGLKGSYRAVYSEADYLPGLIVDKYESALSIQILTAGMEAWKDTLIKVLDEVFGPELIVLRNDSRSRNLEGLLLYKEVVKGDLNNLPVIEEGGVRIEVDPYEGQKTGYFLDQRENRLEFKSLVKGGRGLDLFSYSGGWGLQLAAAGARVNCVDESEKALSIAKRNAELNGFEGGMSFTARNVFDFLKEEAPKGERAYDFIVLDPPAFVKSAKKIKEAEKAYRELNRMAMGLLRPGGLLATSSCSYHMAGEIFADVLLKAGHLAGRGFRVLAFRGQAKDHPVLFEMPETGYLKCVFLVMD